jgi:hypothetical protein
MSGLKMPVMLLLAEVLGFKQLLDENDICAFGCS